PKPFEDFRLKEILSQLFVADNRRIAERKKGIPQSWLARFNTKLGRPEIFESPNMINISETGMAFESLFPYRESDSLLIWILIKSQTANTRMLELSGTIVLRKKSGAKFQYGVHFDDLSEENQLYFKHFIR